MQSNMPRFAGDGVDSNELADDMVARLNAARSTNGRYN